MARTDMSAAAAAAMEAYEKRDQAKANGERRSPIYGYTGVGLLVLFLLGYGIYYLIINRNPPLNSTPEKLAAYIGSPQYGKLNDDAKRIYRDKFRSLPSDQQDAAMKTLSDDQKDLFDENRPDGRPPQGQNNPWAKQREEFMQKWNAAHSAAERRALMDQPPTTQPGGGGPPGGGGAGGRGGGGPGGREGAREATPQAQRAQMGEMRADFHEMRNERSNSN